MATAPRYPGLAGTRRAAVRLRGPAQTIINPPGGAPPSLSVLPGLGTGGLGLPMPGQSAAFTSAPLAAPLQQTGSATVRVRLSGAADITVFAAVYDVDQAGNATLPFGLAAPVQVTGAANSAAHRAPDRHRDAARDGLPVRRGAPAPPGPDQHRLRLRHVADGSGLPGGAGRPGPVRAVGSGAADRRGRRGLVDLGRAGRRAGRGGGDPAGPAAAPRWSGGRLGDPQVPLEITGLTKRYRDGQLAVDGLSLRVERGQILGLLGPNGAGKTTTLRALMGLVNPDAGTITIFGQQVRPGAAALSRLGSFVEGPGFLPHLSGRANLDLYWRATGRPAGGAHLEEVLQIAGLGAALDRRVRSYSRGMSQRLAIAQAMLGLPDLLVLDEPMNGLDPPQIREMREVLLRYAAGGRTVILSSHLLGEVEQTCTHLVVMHRGRGLAAGPVTEITGDGAALIVGTSQAQRAVTVLRGLDGIEAADPHPDGVVVQPNGMAPSAVVAALVGAGIPVDRVGPGRRLEDAFLALIGTPESDQ